MPPLLTADDVAQMLQVKRSWVYAAARQGQIPHVRLGRYIRFREEAIERWLAGREQQSRG
jgi:excisionase family DNA binding protein